MEIFRYYILLMTLYCLIPLVTSETLRNTNYSLKDCKCGLTYSARPRIIGGVKAKESEYPWQAALFELEDYYCAGSIINERYILSAGHCFKDFIPDEGQIKHVPKHTVTIVLGAHHIDVLLKMFERKDQPYFYYPLEVMLHPFFEPYFYTSDISLIKLDRDIVLSHRVLPICLPQSENTYEGQTAFVSGWGATEIDGSGVNDLITADVKVLESNKCETLMRHYYKKEIMLCAASPGRDACRGDSGGPLILKINNHQYMQIGLVSFGISCGNHSRPGLYTKISAYLNWIHTITNYSDYCL